MTEIARDYTAKLPVETIGEIFKLVFDYNVHEYDLSTTQSFSPDIPLILGAVATRWRDITLDMPYLWTFIQLDLRKYVKRDDGVADEEFLLSYLRRSGNKPLRLAIVAIVPDPNSNNDPWATVDSTVYPISLIPASRIFVFYLRSYVPWRMLECQIRLILEFPSLQKLDINGGAPSRYRDVVLNAPRLQSFHLGNSELFNVIGELPDSLAALFISTTRLSGAPDILSAPGVKSLYLRDSCLGRDHLIFPKWIHTLTLEDCDRGNLSNVFHCISSSLTRLALRFCNLSEINSLYMFLEKAGSIATLELVDLAWKTIAWAWVLRHLSSLEVLHLEETGSNHRRRRREDKGGIDCVWNALGDLEDRLPSLSRIHIASDTLVPAGALISFISSHVSTVPIQIFLSRQTFSSADISTLQTIVCMFVTSRLRNCALRLTTTFLVHI
jgi:hypothetical protein